MRAPLPSVFLVCVLTLEQDTRVLPWRFDVDSSGVEPWVFAVAVGLTVVLAVILLFVGVACAWALSPAGRLRRRIRKRMRAPRRLVRAIGRDLQELDRALDASARSYVEAQVLERMRSLSLDSLKDEGAKRVRWGALRDEGLRTVADLHGMSALRIARVKGVGATTAPRIAAAVKRSAQREREKPPTAPGVELGSNSAIDLARDALLVLQWRDALGEPFGSLRNQLARLQSLRAQWSPRAGLSSWLFEVFARERAEETRTGLRALLDELDALGRSSLLADLETNWKKLATERHEAREPDYVRAEIELCFSDFLALVAQSFTRLGFGAPDGDQAIRGGLTDEIVERVQGAPLECSSLRVTLRAYQEFGAKYLLVQRRTILGDEMGLGKTIQVLAAMTHLWELARSDARCAHFFVVAPAGLIWNWKREVERRAPFAAWAIHGSDAPDTLLAWQRDGGLAVTSYATLRNLVADGELPDVELDFFAADEAHYMKNPDAKRTRAAVGLAEQAELVCLLTGTPQENHPREFLNLIRVAQPVVAAKLHRAGDFEQDARAALRDLSGAFQREVAGVYLRRNQAEVLQELPDRIEVEEWVELSGTELELYRAAVRRSDFMGMRSATSIGSSETASKLEHLEDLLADHRESGRKVLVFSTFLAVLDAVARRFGAVGTIRGDVDPKARIELVERFSALDGFALLACQIDAAGTGLNLQAASVVVLMEPQVKPTTEDQAIARAHRMGQTQRVIVHRLLARATVDERLVDLLSAKRDLFDAFARDTELKGAGLPPESLQRRVLEEERERLASVGGV